MAYNRFEEKMDKKKLITLRIPEPYKKQTGVRAPVDWIKAIDAWAREHMISRNDAILFLVLEGIRRQKSLK
jgi:hypothetical protein